MRLYAFVRLVLALALLVLRLLDIEAARYRVLYPAFFESIFLLVYLSWPGLQRRLGRFYLPLALAVATVTPIVTHAINVQVRLATGLTPAAAAADAAVWAFVLFVPLLLLAWQYETGAVVLFCAGTFLLEISLLVAMGGARPVLPASLALISVRTLIYALVGYFIVRLMRLQRSQRQALARHAAAIEQLAQSRERNRLARELHDTLAHSLSAVAVQLEGAKTQWEEDQTAAHDLVTKALVSARQGLSEARRAIGALRAGPIEDLGLALALRDLSVATAERAGLDLHLDIPPALGGLDPTVEQAVYRIAAEALANVALHARAQRLKVIAQKTDGRLSLTVADDGRGFRPDVAGSNGRYGLKGMQEGAELIGGQLTISSQPGHGAVVYLTVEPA